jgi:cephalosporin-C deacetylase
VEYEVKQEDSMGYTEEVAKDLFTYCPPLTKRPDFDGFWEETMEKTRKVPLNPERRLYDYPSSHVKVYDIAYNGFDETRIHGWLILPSFIKKDKFPCLIHYHGFTGNRGTPADFMQWIIQGVAVLSVDCREQSGKTGNCAHYTGGSTQSVVSKGLLDKNGYYFRAVYMDCVKAVDFACSQEEVDASRIIIEGGSQGGALGMAVCGLDSRPYLAMVDVPSNSNLDKRVEGAHGSFGCVTDYLKQYPHQTDQVLETLSYFDTMNLAERIQCKILASVGLKDNICPAKMYFASYNRIQTEKEIRLYPFNGHEGGGAVHNEVKLRFLLENL